MDVPDLGGKVGVGVGVGTALLIAAAIAGVPLLLKANRAIDAERKEAKQAVEPDPAKVLRKKQRDQCIHDGKL